MLYLSDERENDITRTKTLLLALLCAVWVCAGLVGHDPWKPEDAHTFGVVYDMLKSGDWLVPSIAGDVYLDKPPLFYLTAAAFAKLFSPWLALHNGARLASGFYTVLTLLFTGLAGRELFGRGRGRAAVVILIGCLGMQVTAHQMVTDLPLLTGCAMMQYGFTLSHRRPQRGGLLMGLGMGMGFMAKGFIAPMLFLLIGGAMLIFRNWRVRPYYISLGLAALVALPWLLIWPVLLYLHSPQLFTEWAWTNNLGRWLAYARGGNYGEALYYLRTLPWFAWPALPLAAWAVWQARARVWHTIEFQLPLTSFLVMLAALSLEPETKDVFALPMLLPLALLATAALFTLRRGAANALDWFGIMTFGLIAILMWWGWAGLLQNNNAWVTHVVKDYQPGFHPTLRLPAFCVALSATLLWIVLVWRVGRSMRRAVINWAAGVTLILILAMSLWLPWLDSGKSYRETAASLKQALPEHYDCIINLNVSPTQRAMLQYHADFTTTPDVGQNCSLLLTQDYNATRAPVDEKKWQRIWAGNRSSDRDERFRLYRRI